jgi:GDPmannose 4,6-dehydratase
LVPAPPSGIVREQGSRPIVGGCPEGTRLAPKKALITGITGQDGSYLAELLLERGYDVHGLVRRTSLASHGRIERAQAGALREGRVFELHEGDLADSASLNRVVERVRPDELYNLAGQSHVGVSFEQPEYTTDVCGTGVLRLLEALRASRPETRFYQASTSELFGAAEESPQDELTPFRPRSPYAVAKLYGFFIAKSYRDGYGLHASNGILFNHESPRRGENFVTRKITLGLARARAGLEGELYLGRLDARRDWGHARDYVELMWRMLQEDEPDDYVAATGVTHSVREFVEAAGAALGFEIAWEGSGPGELGRDRKSGRVLVRVDPKLWRPTEVEALVGDATKARERLGWQPRVTFEQLVEEMAEADLALVRTSA